MASGGGSHPSHLPIATAHSHSSNSASLQTPDTSSLFVTTLGSGGPGRIDGGMGGSGFPSTVDQEPHSFTSLEELLDVTGINSMELAHPHLDGMKETSAASGGGHGVNSLQMLAREVEMNSSQQELTEPPSKRPRVEPSNSNFVGSPGSMAYPALDKLGHSTSNIRVQNLHVSPPSRSPSNSATHLSPVPSPSPSCHTQLVATQSPASVSTSPATRSPLQVSNPPTPIVSLLDKRLSPSSGDADGLLDPTQQKEQQQQFVSVGLVAGPPKVLGRPIHSPPPYSSVTATTSSSSHPVSNFSSQSFNSTDYLQKGSLGSFATSSAHSSTTNNFHLANTTSIGQATSWATKSQASRSESLHQPGMSTSSVPATSHPTANLHHLATPNAEGRSAASQIHNNAHLGNDKAVSILKSKPAAPSVSTPSQVAESINSNSRAVVIQLIQLYKQYQEANDQQGMARVREQINFLVTAQQKILAAKNNILKTTTGTTPSNSVSQSLVGSKLQVGGEPLVGGAGLRLGSAEGSRSEQQQQANKILGQLAGLKKNQQQLPQAAGVSLLTSSSSPAPASSAYRNQGNFGLSTSTPGLTLGAGEVGSSNGRTTAGTNPAEEVVASSGLSGRGAVGPAKSVFGLPAVSTATASASMSSQQNAVQTGQNPGLRNSQEDTQKTLKQLQLLMSNLPESKRPKNLQELKVFVQQYSNLVAKGNAAPLNKLQPAVASTFTTTLPSYSASLERTQSQIPPSNAAHLSHPLSSMGKQPVASSLSFLPTATTVKTGMTAGAAHAQGKLAAHQGGLLSHLGSMSTNALTSHLVGGDTNSLKQPQASTNLSLDSQPRVNVAAMAVETAAAAQASLSLKSSATSTVPTAGGQSINFTAATKSGGIQPGVATPLPSGVTLETLGVLCRLPDNDLMKLNLPPPLLSAIKVWKARQGSGKTKASNTTNKNNIPVLIPPPAYPLPSVSTASSSINSTSSSAARSGHNQNHHHSLTGSKTESHTSLPTISKSLLVGQPNVLPSGAGFPPRSLHAFVPRPSMGMAPQVGFGYIPISYDVFRDAGYRYETASQHMTRFKVKMEQHKAETERLQALQKALQSSEEARIAYRFSAHLEKMHTQLMNPDTVSGFKSHHDILARLLPYHIYAEPEPPEAAVEKADAVFESVAQVLLSRSRGLKSRYDKIMLKTESEGGLEQSKMKFQLEQLFVKGEHERIQRENQEKKEAEQIAANLSTMAETADSFDDDFSFGDVFSPLMSLNSGIT